MAASVAERNRDEALDKVYEEIEKNLIVSLMKMGAAWPFNYSLMRYFSGSILF